MLCCANATLGNHFSFRGFVGGPYDRYIFHQLFCTVDYGEDHVLLAENIVQRLSTGDFIKQEESFRKNQKGEAVMPKSFL